MENNLLMQTQHPFFSENGMDSNNNSGGLFLILSLVLIVGIAIIVTIRISKVMKRTPNLKS